MAAWDWLVSLPPGAASLVGTLAGSSLGLIALLIGALFNARLNRKRDDRIRDQEAKAIRTALKAELSGVYDSLVRNFEMLEQTPPTGDFTVPDPAHSVRVIPVLLPKIGLLDEETIRATLDVYVSLDQYAEGMLLMGGQIMKNNREGRILIAMPGKCVKQVAGTNRNMAEMLKPVIDGLTR